MKKKVHAKRVIIPSIKLYREDLDEILALFHSNCEGATISDADFVYESLDDMKSQVSSKVRDIEIAGTKPNIALTLMRGNCQLSSRSEGVELTKEEMDKGDLLFSRLKEFLMNRKRMMTKIITIPVAIIACASVFGAAFLLSKHYPRPEGDGTFALLIVFSCVAIISSTVAITSGGFRYVSLELRGARSSFWERNRDHIWLALICGIIGSLITLGVEWLKHTFSK